MNIFNCFKAKEPTIDVVKNLILDKGDILVLTIAGRISDDTLHKLKTRLEDFLKKEGIDNRVLVLTHGMDIRKISGYRMGVEAKA